MKNNRVKDYKDAFKSEAGQRVLADLVKFCHCHHPTFVAGDPYTSAFNEGMRRVFLRINGFLKMSDEDMRQLVNQYVKEQ